MGMSPDIHIHALISRHSEGPGAETGDWIIDWIESAGSPFSWSTHIETPSGTRVVYEHGILVVSEDISRVIGGNFGVKKRSVFDGPQRIDFERYTYQAVPVIQYTSPFVWWGTAELDERIIERDGRTYETRYFFDDANFGDYHHPNAIVEDGDLARTTLLTYHHYQTPAFVVGLPATSQVAINGVSPTASSWTHDSATGFMTSATVAGITTTFDKDTLGNVSQVTKANGKSVSYSYNWGQVSSVVTAEHTTSRSINPDGTVASETRAGRTTSYQYDNLFRVTSTQPPGGTNAIITEYDNEGQLRLRRGRCACPEDGRQGHSLSVRVRWQRSCANDHRRR